MKLLVRTALIVGSAFVGGFLTSPAVLRWNPLTKPFPRWLERLATQPCNDTHVIGFMSPACVAPMWPELVLVAVMLGGAVAAGLIALVGTRRPVGRRVPHET